ncbi:MAG: hypothetical protein AAF745_00585 [Planctomycetota bacterium]
MSGFQLRPTFVVPLDVSRHEAMRRLQRTATTQITDRTDAIRFVMKGEYGELHLPSDQIRLWSPQLSISINDDEPPTFGTDTSTKCRLHGRFAPRFHVWSAVWAVYLMMATIVFFSLIVAASQAMMGWAMSGLWIAATALMTILALNVSARLGQRWSADQMRTLRHRLDELLDEHALVDAIVSRSR